MYKSNVPYYQVAREALIKWNGLSEEQADKIIEESSFEEIESQVYAQGSITAAATSIGKNLGLNEEEISQFVDEVFGRTESIEITEKLHKELGNKMLSTFRSSRNNYMPQLVTDTMEDVHNNWVSENAGAFLTKKADRKQQYQYLPLELIGWDEAKSDLLFIRPIIHSIGGYADDNEIKEECNKRTIKFFDGLTYTSNEGTLGMRVQNLDDLGNEIAENGLLDDYAPLDATVDDKGTTLRDIMENVDFVKENILPQLREKGFIKDDELMDKLETSHVFETDGASRDEVIEGLLQNENFVATQDPELVAQELEYLRDKKQRLQEEKKKISETEKLIDAKENQAPSLDE